MHEKWGFQWDFIRDLKPSQRTGETNKTIKRGNTMLFNVFQSIFCTVTTLWITPFLIFWCLKIKKHAFLVMSWGKINSSLWLGGGMARVPPIGGLPLLLTDFHWIYWFAFICFYPLIQVHIMKWAIVQWAIKSLLVWEGLHCAALHHGTLPGSPKKKLCLIA